MTDLAKLLLLIIVLGNLPASLGAAENTDEALESSIESLKKEVLSLNRDLFILEEDLLFPANTQFSIFLSMNTGLLFTLDSVQLRIDDKNVAEVTTDASAEKRPIWRCISAARPLFDKTGAPAGLNTRK